MKKYTKIILIASLTGLVVMGVFAYRVYDTFFGPNTRFTTKSYELYIPTGSSYEEAFKIVAAAVDDRDALHQTATKKGYHKNVKPGRYILKQGMSNNDIVDNIRSSNVPIRVQFNNQERLENLAGRIGSQLEADSLSLLTAMRDSVFLEDHGFNQNNALSMYLPNQFEFYWNTSAAQFRKRMLEYHDKFWNEKRLAQANRLELNPSQVYVLASIVQKETAAVDERPRVAGVYLNRMRKGIKLDADPTVIYSKKLADNDFDQIIKRVLYKDLEIDSPYNTYQNAGLPPGPIVTPDLNAIDAVLNPENHDYYYFVADVENFGYHKFAKTLAQHNRNAVAYRNWVARQ
ncbi:MAG: endolytic transglycosylase MltG [Nonlabens sp.]